MIQLPFGLAVIQTRIWDTVVDHAARLLAERSRLIVQAEQNNAIIAIQQRTIIALDREVAALRDALRDADRLLGIGD